MKYCFYIIQNYLWIVKKNIKTKLLGEKIAVSESWDRDNLNAIEVAFTFKC